MGKNNARNILVHREGDGAALEARVSAFYGEVIEGRLRRSGLPARRQLEELEELLRRLEEGDTADRL